MQIVSGWGDVGKNRPAHVCCSLIQSIQPCFPGNKRRHSPQLSSRHCLEPSWHRGLQLELGVACGFWGLVHLAAGSWAALLWAGELTAWGLAPKTGCLPITWRPFRGPPHWLTSRGLWGCAARDPSASDGRGRDGVHFQVFNPGPGAGRGPLTRILPEPLMPAVHSSSRPKPLTGLVGARQPLQRAEERWCFKRCFRAPFSLELFSKTCGPGHNPS